MNNVTTRPIYQGRMLRLNIELAELPNGRRCELEIVHHPGGAAVVVLDNARRVCLLRQYRHAASDWLWELPAGKLEPGEPAEQTARRELQEEAGVQAAEWRSLGQMHSSPGVFTEVIHLYFAHDLAYTQQQLGADELLEVHWIEGTKALSWASDGTISDAKTLIGLYRAAAASLI